MNRRRPGASTAARHADPSLRGLVTGVPFHDVWVAALEVARRSARWSVTAAEPAEGVIAAEATTPVWKFVDQVVIRISLDERGSTRVDVSSHSRVGRYDFGVNARRIRHYLKRLRRSLEGT